LTREPLACAKWAALDEQIVVFWVLLSSGTAADPPHLARIENELHESVDKVGQFCGGRDHFFSISRFSASIASCRMAASIHSLDFLDQYSADYFLTQLLVLLGRGAI
jgi:hypothetical protein